MGETPTLEFAAKATGNYELIAVMTMASDYAAVRLGVGGKPPGQPIDLVYSPGVATRGV